METTIQIKDGITVVGIAGSINSANAGELERALRDEPNGTNGIMIDAKELDYISSAGLRVLLMAKKRCKDKLFRIVNVNLDVKNIFDVTGFSDIMDIRTAQRHVSIAGCDRIGAGACGEVFRLNDETIIKLYYDGTSQESIELEKSLAKKAFVMGVPTAISYDIVEADGRTGVVYELINSKTLGEMIRSDSENIDRYIDMYVNVCRDIHKIDGKGQELPSFKDLNRADIPRMSGITEEESDLLYRFLDIVPDGTQCIHGDLNINNIMVQNGECCLIDMGEFSVGTPMFDISRIVFSMEFASVKPDEYNAFYKMPQTQVNYIYRTFMKKYFDCENLEEAEKKDSDVIWLYPLAWFRTCTSMLKDGANWQDGKREMAEQILREKLIPFIKSHI